MEASPPWTSIPFRSAVCSVSEVACLGLDYVACLVPDDPEWFQHLVNGICPKLDKGKDCRASVEKGLCGRFDHEP